MRPNEHANGNGSITTPTQRAEIPESVSSQIRQLAGEFKVRMNHDSLTPQFVSEVIADYQNRGVLHDAFSIDAIQALSEIEGMQMDVRDAVTRHVSALQAAEDTINQAIIRTRAIDRERFDYRKTYCDPRKNYLLPQRVKSGVVEVYDILASTPGAQERFLHDYHFERWEIADWKQKKESDSNGSVNRVTEKPKPLPNQTPPAVHEEVQQLDPLEQVIHDALQNVTIDHELFWKRRKMNYLKNAKLPKFVKMGIVQIFDAVADTPGVQEYLLENFKFRREEIDIWRKLSEQSSGALVVEKPMETVASLEIASEITSSPSTDENLSFDVDAKAPRPNSMKQAIYDALQTIDIQNKQRFWRRRNGVHTSNDKLPSAVKMGMVQLFDAIATTPGAQEYLLSVYKFTRAEIHMWRELEDQMTNDEPLPTIESEAEAATSSHQSTELNAPTVEERAANEPAVEAEVATILEEQTPAAPPSNGMHAAEIPTGTRKTVRRGHLPSFITHAPEKQAPQTRPPRPSVINRPIENKDVLKRTQMVVEGDPQMEEAWYLSQMYAEGNMVMLYRGERGTGKELFPRAVHQLSKKGIPFLAVNCAGYNEGVVESELFGHVKGAFTNAVTQQEGAFGAVKGGGMLLLDEVGDMPLSQQAKLLRVLENREYHRVGSTEMISLSKDTKILAATNRNLEQLVEEGRFRSDLYDRLRGCQIFIPPLRERAMPHRQALITHFMRQQQQNADYSYNLSEDALQYMLQHDYPGNVREMRDHIERSCLLAKAQTDASAKTVTITMDHILTAEDMSSVQLLQRAVSNDASRGKSYFNGALQIAESSDPSNVDPAINFTVHLRNLKDIAAIMEAVSVKICRGAMNIYGNNQSLTAESIGITRGSLRRKLRINEVLDGQEQMGE